MKEFIKQLIERMKSKHIPYLGMDNSVPYGTEMIRLFDAIKIAKELAEEYKGGWISVKDRLPEYENKDGSWVRCIVKVMRSHYPTSTYDDCDSPYDETIVMCAMYDVKQKIWHLDCDEQLNALIDIEDAPMNGDYVIEWMSLKSL